MKWLAGILAGLGVLWAMFSGMFTGKWKKRANETLIEAEKQALENLNEETLRDKEHVLEVLDRTRGLDDDDRLRLALIRARLRRARDERG